MNKFMTMTSVVALLTGISGLAFADHTTEHVVQNLKGGLGAVERRGSGT